MSQHEKGQYFTTNLSLKKKVFEFILNNPDTILEPSFGQGDLVKYTQEEFKKNNKLISYDMYEIDEKIKMLDGIDHNNYEYCDYLAKKIKKKYTTIIGNPPYVKTKTGNLYIDFIDKCVSLLKKNGELIFIIPSDFFKLTMAKRTLVKMLKYGSFTHIYHPNDESLFKNASIDVLIFRYVKNPKLKKQVLYNNAIDEKLLFITNSDGLITFAEQDQTNMKKIEDLYDVYVGIVSGKDSVYKNDTLGNISVLNGMNVVNEVNTLKKYKYIYVKSYPSGNKEIDEYLLSKKEELIGRKIRKFNSTNWFEWGAPRNIKIMEEHKDQECIYVINITRKNIIAFKDKIQYFGGSLIMLKPKNNITETLNCELGEIIDKTLSHLNSDKFKKIFTYSNRFKIGHRQLSKSFIDI